jgi:DNA-binding MarR family transcriptional regulator
MSSLLQELLTKVPLPGVLRERVALADEKYQRAIDEIESWKQRFAVIERENEALRARTPGDPASGLGGDTARVLVHLFMTEPREERDLGTMAKKLGMERNTLQYHLDHLEEAGLTDLESGKLLYGRECWELTPTGRKRVVECNLVCRHP